MKLVTTFLSKKRYSYALVLSLAVLAFSLIMSNLYWHHPVGEWLAASPVKVFEKEEYWRLFTSAFIHGDLAHFLSNSIMLSLMGYFVVSHYGAWVFPGLSFFAGGLINYLVILTFQNDINLVGASGVVYFLWGYWLVLYILIERQVPLTRRFMKVIAVSLAILVPTSYEPNVSYLAHAVGMILGIIFGGGYYVFNRRFIRSFEEYEMVEEEPEIDFEEEEDYFIH